MSCGRSAGKSVHDRSRTLFGVVHFISWIGHATEPMDGPMMKMLNMVCGIIMMVIVLCLNVWLPGT